MPQLAGATIARRSESLLRWGGFALVLAGIAATANYSYVLFHTLVEVFRIVVIFGIATLAWNARREIDNPFLLVAGLSYPSIGVLELLHTLSYKGMGVFPPDANLPTQLWIAFRGFESAAMLFAATFLGRPAPPARATAAGFLAIGSTLGWLVLTGRFPDCFVAGSGLTTFKVIAEYVIAGGFAATLILLRRHAEEFAGDILPSVVLSLGCGVAAELAFTRYVSVYGLANYLGHLLLLTSTYFLYRALLIQGIRKPQLMLFHHLNREREILAQSEAELARKVAERTAQVRRLNEELEQRVAERTAQLEAANKELETFSYSVSHDLRAPLRAIDGFSQMLVKRYGERLDDEGKRLLRVVRDNTAHMGQLIDDILSFSRAGRLELRHAAIDMEALARDVWQDLAIAGTGRDIRFELHPLPPTRGDTAMIRQVLVNLLGNAVKFTRPRAQAHIEVGGTVEGDECIYYVADDGVGFDANYINKLFGVFQRLHRVDEFEGTGIGLAIVKCIVERHGGRVWAQGKVDAGACFHFSLPAPHRTSP
jgi:signal transduction histidine kinase